MIHIGSYVSAASVFVLALSSSIPAAVFFVVILSLGEALWSPRCAKPQTPNPKPQTPDFKPQTPYSKPRAPKPELVPSFHRQDATSPRRISPRACPVCRRLNHGGRLSQSFFTRKAHSFKCQTLGPWLDSAAALSRRSPPKKLNPKAPETRFYDYTVSVAPEGKEGTFMAMSSAPLFVATLPTGRWMP